MDAARLAVVKVQVQGLVPARLVVLLVIFLALE